jgi:hypothetical protein
MVMSNASEKSSIAGKMRKSLPFLQRLTVSYKVQCTFSYDPVILVLGMYVTESKTKVHIKTYS